MPAPPDVKIETVNLAPGIYMLIGRGGNVGLTVGVDGAAIIDDQFADMAPKIRAAVAMLSDQPVKFVINTHLHGDHTGGNDAFGKSGAVIIAQENVRKRLGTAQVNPSTNAPIAARAREALPVVTFADSATLHFNDDDLEFTHLPNAHTETDIVVRFRKANIVHMGDLFVGGFPFIDGNTGGTLDGLIRAHEAVLATIDDNTKIIRGHGPLGNKAELQAYPRHARGGARSRGEAGQGRQEPGRGGRGAPDEGVRGKIRRRQFQRGAVDRPRLRRPEDRAGEAQEEVGRRTRARRRRPTLRESPDRSAVSRRFGAT